MKGLRKGERLSWLSWGQARVRGFTFADWQRAVNIKKGIARALMEKELNLFNQEKQNYRLTFSFAIKAYQIWRKKKGSSQKGETKEGKELRYTEVLKSKPTFAYLEKMRNICLNNLEGSNNWTYEGDSIQKTTDFVRSPEVEIFTSYGTYRYWVEGEEFVRK